MARLCVAAALVALLLLPGVGAAWTQAHGGPDRNMRIALPGGPLDVIRVADTPEAFTNTFWGTRALPTPSGLVLMEDTDEGCNMLVVPPPYLAVGRSMPVRDCNFGMIMGYDPVQDTIVLCDNSPTDLATLRALRVSDGREVWGVIPQRDLNAVAGSLRWLCLGAAIDVEARQFAVGFEGYGVGPNGVDHLVAMGNLDSGGIAWRTDLPAAPPVLPLNSGYIPETYPRSIYPRGIALTTTGVVVTGFYGCGPGQTNAGTFGCLEEGFVAWFSRDGDYQGMESAIKPAAVEAVTSSGMGTGVPVSRAVSQYAVASGPIAAIALGEEVLLVNPEVPTPVLRGSMAAVEATTSSVFWYPGAWTEGELIIPIVTSLTAFEPATLEPKWSYTEGLESRFTDILVTTGGETYVLFTDVADFVHHVVVLKTATGELVRRIPIPGDLPDEHKEGGWRAHMMPLEGQGIAIVDLMGSVVILGTAAPEHLPDVRASTAFPAPGEELTLEIDTRGAEVVRVQWGDGTEETLAPGAAANHSYAERGARDVAVMAVFADGTTATRTIVLDVGGTPPPELTSLQKAFAPENQNLTFGVLGIAITVLGAIVTLGRQRRRFGRLERELAAVEEIRMMSIGDPRAAVLALKEYRDRLPEDLLRRRIDDAQFGILDQRSARLLKVLRTRLLAPYDARLSPRFHRLLDAAFEDAVLQHSERDVLEEALADERELNAIDREELRKTLHVFTSERADVRLRPSSPEGAVHNNS